MTSNRIGRYFAALLPPEYVEVERLSAQLQEFFEQNLPAPMNQAVTLLTINREEIVIAANSPLVANYLRLHSEQIRQQLLETFDLHQALTFRSLPAALLELPKPAAVPAPARVSAAAVEALKRNAMWIEDDDLKAAMLSLANSLRSD